MKKVNYPYHLGNGRIFGFRGKLVKVRRDDNKIDLTASDMLAILGLMVEKGKLRETERTLMSKIARFSGSW
jgi:hypothetical protein